MAIPTALLAKVLGGLGVLATAATVTVIATRPKDGNTQEDPLKALNEKIKGLGITGCDLGKDESSKTCTLDKAKIEKIKFDGKTEGASASESTSLSLKIEKGYEDLGFPEGLRFSFTNSSSNDITIGDSPNQITFKSGITYDYKIKTSGNTTTLEKAWTIAALADKVGLTCTDTDTECTLKTEGINVWKEEEDYITGATQTDSNKKITVTKESSGYLEGFKFTVKDTGDITLTGGTKKKATDGISKLTKTNNTSYGIDVKDIGGIKTWFLVEKSTSVPQESQ